MHINRLSSESEVAIELYVRALDVVIPLLVIGTLVTML